jgi:hypothetical protein
MTSNSKKVGAENNLIFKKVGAENQLGLIFIIIGNTYIFHHTETFVKFQGVSFSIMKSGELSFVPTLTLLFCLF